MSDVVARCADCGLPYSDEGFCDLVVRNDVWEIISPTGDEGGLLCPTCLLRALVRNRIECTGQFTSGPLTMHLVFVDEITRLRAQRDETVKALRALQHASEVTLARIREWEPERLPGEYYREWGGHVEPVLEQLKTFHRISSATLAEIEGE